MAELADASDLGSDAFGVQVRPLLSAPTQTSLDIRPSSFSLTGGEGTVVNDMPGAYQSRPALRPQSGDPCYPHQHK